MKTAPGMLFIDTVGPAVTSEVVGEDVVLSCRGLSIASIRRGDPLSRDVAIVALGRLGQGLTTGKIATLCGASHGWVCKVRQRFRSGGMGAVAARARPGPARILTGRKEERLKELHAAGKSQREIGRKLGVSSSLVNQEIKRLGLPRRGSGMQSPLPGVGGKPRPTKTRSSTPDKSVRESEGTTEDGRRGENGAEVLISEGAESAEPAAAQADDGEERACRVGELEAPAVVEPDGRIQYDGLFEALDEASGEDESEELQPGRPLRSGPTEHVCRYSGMLLLCAAATVIGVPNAIALAHVVRPEESVYSAHQVLLALMASWGAGYGSLEAMQERDARSLGVILGLERSPSVRTLHRAINQMGKVFDPSALSAELMRGVMFARLPERLWFGADGHFKAYSGEAPIDKGWDAKRRIASKGLGDVVLTDDRGWAWEVHPVGAGDALSQSLLTRARALRAVVGDARPIVIAFDRGGFDFDVLRALDLEGFGYAGYVPASVKLPDLSTIAPLWGGVGEVLWTHHRLHHNARLIVERDGDARIPVVTNLPTLVDAVEVMNDLRACRGAQENAFKAARAFVNIDALVDRGVASLTPDDRLVKNPARAALKKEKLELEARMSALKSEDPEPGVRSRVDIRHDEFWAGFDHRHTLTELRTTPAEVPRITIEPDAKRAVLKTTHRLLLQPLKFATDNARRWLLGTLGSALAPTDHDDEDTLSRTLLALLRAPGTVRFDDDIVHVTLDFPLPPTAHRRIDDALQRLDGTLQFTDARRRIAFRLASRPTRDALYSGAVATR